jgi:hypothetical protein
LITQATVSLGIAGASTGGTSTQTTDAPLAAQGFAQDRPVGQACSSRQWRLAPAGGREPLDGIGNASHGVTFWGSGKPTDIPVDR